VTHIKKSSNRLGDVAEHYAVTWLWDNGYEVFKNAGSDGAVDIVAWDKSKNEFLLLDIKTKGAYPSGRSRTKEQMKYNIKLVMFDKNTRKLRFVEHKK